MKTFEITTEEVANYFTTVLEKETVNFINGKADKIYCASYRSGAYGRIFSKFIQDNFKTKLNLNGASTSLALEITRQLENTGYSFKKEAGKMTFVKN